MKHYNAAEVFNAIMEKGGPDRRNDFKVVSGYSFKLYFFDWDHINEFFSSEQALWWEKLAEVTDVKPGDTFYLDFD